MNITKSFDTLRSTALINFIVIEPKAAGKGKSKLARRVPLWVQPEGPKVKAKVKTLKAKPNKEPIKPSLWQPLIRRRRMTRL